MSLPAGELANHLLMLWSNQNQPSSLRSITSKVKKFLLFCDAQQRQPVPCSDTTLLLYVSYLSWEGRVSAEYFPQYVSAVRTFHRYLLQPAPAPNVVLASVLRSALATQKAVATTTSKLPLPAVYVWRAIAHGLRTPHLSEQRLCLFFVLKYLFGVRGATILPLHVDNIGWSTSKLSVTCMWDSEKQRHHTVAARPVTLFFPACPALLHLLSTYQDAAAPSHSFWNTPAMLPMPPVSVAFQQFLSLLCVPAPPGGKYTGHSTRSGFVASLRGLSVPLEVAAEVAGWSLTSSAVYKYLRFRLQADDYTYTMFCSLLDPVTAATARTVFKCMPL